MTLDEAIQTARRPSIRRRGRLALAVGAVAALAGFAARSTLWVTTRPVAAPIHLSFLRPAGTELTNTGRPVLAISPDGTKIVFNADNQLYLRRLGAAESVPIPGTQGTGVQTPFFSADGRWVAFFSVETGELKRIPVDGGVAVTICRWPAGSPASNFGASWTADNQILFATLEGVFRVSADGGTPQKIVRLNAGETVHGPQLLPDGDHVLLTITTATGADRWDKAQVIAQSLSSDARTVLIEKGADGRYLDTGHIIYAVGTTLFAVAADVQSLRILGAPVIMLRDVRRSATPAVTTAGAFVAISKTGDLAYIPDAPQTSINVSVDLSGRLTPMPDNGLAGIHVSRDGSQMVAMRGDAWWIYSLSRRAAPDDSPRRKGRTSIPSGRLMERASCSDPDGNRARGCSGGAPTAAARRNCCWPSTESRIGWSPDGEPCSIVRERSVVVEARRKPRSLVSIDGPYASLSPDGRWVAFHATRAGHPLCSVALEPRRAFSDFAELAATRRCGHLMAKLFYVSETNSLMAIDVPNNTHGRSWRASRSRGRDGSRPGPVRPVV